ncbi:MAG TPA: phosphate/phosphite/phosphonate ABC transporter substrate-binding protein [Hyphomicrobiaceae bacterium]|nr:phosphate/phosphite/phosphonate ABC transporter substrate-binding protein [Hyphomicrobiaceae bacterium]
MPPLGVMLAAAALALLGACSPAEPATYEPTYGSTPAAPLTTTEILFAVHPLHNPRRLFEVYQPLVDLINERIWPTYHMRLETSRDYATFEQKLAAGKFQFAIPNPYQTLVSESHGYRIIGKMGSDQRFRGIILVRRDSGELPIAALKGAPISFPAPTALAATMMPRMFLHQHGLDVADIDARYVGSQESSIMNVLLGKTIAGGTWPPPWEAFQHRRPMLARQLMVRWETDPLVNNGLVVQDGVSHDLTSKISDIIFHLHETPRGRSIIEAMEIDRFDPASAKTFEPVRQFVADYEATFGRRP